MRVIYFVCCVGLLLFAMPSCIPTNKLYYFHNQEPNIHSTEASKALQPLRIQQGDKINITVSCPDPTQTAFLNPFNTQNTGNASGGAGFVVNSIGQIDFPLIGKVSVAGLSSEQAADSIKKKLQHYYRDPYVYVNLTGKIFFINGKNGMAIPLNNERLTIFEALAQVGIQDHFERRDAVWIVREENNQRSYQLVNLNDKSIFNSPYYYLHNNDLIYIRPNQFYSLFAQNSPVRNAFLGISAVLGLFFAFNR